MDCLATKYKEVINAGQAFLIGKLIFINQRLYTLVVWVAMDSRDDGLVAD